MHSGSWHLVGKHRLGMAGPAARLERRGIDQPGANRRFECGAVRLHPNPSFDLQQRFILVFHQKVVVTRRGTCMTYQFSIGVPIVPCEFL